MQVHEYWSYCGEIEGMDMMTFPDTGRFRGIVFITFTTQVPSAVPELGSPWQHSKAAQQGGTACA